jgi:hypothetical protein
VLVQHWSPGVSFPRVLAMEAVGLAEKAPGGQFRNGQVVATDGRHGTAVRCWLREYVYVPAAQVQALKMALPWETLGALRKCYRPPS